MTLSFREFKDCITWIKNTDAISVSVTLEGITEMKGKLITEHDNELKKLKKMIFRFSRLYTASNAKQAELQTNHSQDYSRLLQKQQTHGLMGNVKEEAIQRIKQTQGEMRFEEKEKQRLILASKEQSKRTAYLKSKSEEYERMEEFFTHVSSIFNFLDQKNINIMDFSSDTFNSLYNEYKTWKVRQ